MSEFEFEDRAYHFARSRRDFAGGGKPLVPGKRKKRTISVRIEGQYHACEVLSVSMETRHVTVNVLPAQDTTSGKTKIPTWYSSYTLPFSQVRRLDLEEILDDERARQELVVRSRFVGRA